MDTSRVNLLNLIGSDTLLDKIAGTNGGEYAGPCPFCGGENRFHVQPYRPGGGRWFCRQCSEQQRGNPTWQDAIAYVMRRDQCGFKEACTFLGVSLSAPNNGYRHSINLMQGTKQRLQLPVSKQWIATEQPEWRQDAAHFVESVIESLWSPRQGTPGRDYLHRRDLNDSTLAAYRIGYNARPYHGTWGDTPVYIPGQSIILPWIEYRTQGQQEPDIVKVKYRTIHQKEFGQAKGGADSLYGLLHFRPGATAVLVESEICAMSLWQAIPEVVPLATGSADGSRLARSIIRLSQAKTIVLAFDNDTEGEKAVLWWQQAFPEAVRLNPTRHDINDMLMAGDDIRVWLESQLS